MYQRHNLAWLSAAGWQAAQEAAQPQHRAALEQWQQQDWPAVVRRLDADTPPGQICLGVTPPPEKDGSPRQRIALRAARAAVTRCDPALALDAVLPALPPFWGQDLAELHERSIGLSLRVYGSAALQALTGQSYLNRRSSIDLLFRPRSPRQLQAGMALFADYAIRLPLEGEIEFPSGAAVAWKEWRKQHNKPEERVLVKQNDRVRLAGVDELLASLELP